MQTTDEHDGSSVGKAEDAQTVEEREEQFRTLAENIPGVATYLDRLIADDPGHSIPLYISPQVEQMLGYPLSEWLDESELWLRILHPEDRDRLVSELTVVALGRFPVATAAVEELADPATWIEPEGQQSQGHAHDGDPEDHQTRSLGIEPSHREHPFSTPWYAAWPRRRSSRSSLEAIDFIVANSKSSVRQPTPPYRKRSR